MNRNPGVTELRTKTLRETRMTIIQTMPKQIHLGSREMGTTSMEVIVVDTLHSHRLSKI
jgi:hypothetical protein